MEIVFLTLIGVVIGSAITWVVAHKYYVKASEKLRKEASELRNLNVLILRGMEEAGFAKFNRDKNGNPVGLVLKISASDIESATTVIPSNLELKNTDKN